MLRLVDIYKIYGQGLGDSEVRALDGVSFNVEDGEFVALVGASGSGKSTCMNIIGCLDTPTEGKYYINDTDVSTMTPKQLAHIRNREIGFVFQQYNLIPKLNVLENIELPLLYRGVSSTERVKMAMRALERVDLSEKAKMLPSQLSGGQQQRVSIARALAGMPPVILADEPTGALDSKTGRSILSFLKDLNFDGTTVIIITHDQSIAVEAKRILQIHDGKIVSDSAN